MAFNPFKKKVDEPILEESNTNILTNEKLENPIKVEKPTYEGNEIADLEKSGISTVKFLKSASNSNQQQKFNIQDLENLPLDFVLESLNAKKTSNNKYVIKSQEISIKDNKWYNTTQKKGNIKAISLVKHLTAIEENINEYENSKTLFVSACKKLEPISISFKEISNNTKDKTSEEVKNVESNKVEHNKTNGNFNNLPYTTIRAMKEAFNNIPLSMVMEHIGATPNSGGARGKWKIWKTGHNIQVTGEQWFNFNIGKGKVGAFSLMEHLIAQENNIDERIPENRKMLEKATLQEFVTNFGSDFSNIQIDKQTEFQYKVPFHMPYMIDFKLNKVRQYLNEKRGIPKWIIEKQISNGSIFAGYPSDWKEDPHLKNPEKLTNDKVWVTFLAVNGNAAEMRAIERTDEYAKFLAKGSDKDSGGFVIKAEKDCNEKMVTACEAAIDAISYHCIYPGRITTSCMGVNFNLACKAAIDALENNYKFSLGFDNDQAGIEASVRFQEKLIDEIGEEDYFNELNNGNIKYFELGIKSLLQTLKNGDTFYFDIKNNELALEAVKMFQKQLSFVMPKEHINNLISQGKIKYINIEPNYANITNHKEEAQNCYNLLMSGKPYYLLIKQPKKSNENFDNGYKLALQNFEKFKEEFFNICKENKDILEKSGKIIYNKQSFAKDWNEYFNLMQKDPKFVNEQKKICDKYENYISKVDIKTKNFSI